MDSVSQIDQAQVWIGKFGLTADGNPAHSLSDSRQMKCLQQTLEAGRIGRDDLENPQFILRSARGQRSRMPQGESGKVSTISAQRGISDTKFVGEGELTAEVHTRENVVGQDPALLQPMLKGA